MFFLISAHCWVVCRGRLIRVSVGSRSFSVASSLANPIGAQSILVLSSVRSLDPLLKSDLGRVVQRLQPLDCSPFLFDFGCYRVSLLCLYRWFLLFLDCLDRLQSCSSTIWNLAPHCASLSLDLIRRPATKDWSGWYLRWVTPCALLPSSTSFWS